MGMCRWGYSKSSLKVSLGLRQGWRPLNISGASFKKSIPSIHPSINPFSLVRSVLLRTLQTILLTMWFFYLFCWWSVWSVLPTVRSVQLTMLLHQNNRAQTVCCFRMACCCRIWTKYRAPYTGPMVPLARTDKARQWSAHIFIWSGQISPIRSYPERKLVCMSVSRAAQIISGSSSS